MGRGQLPKVRCGPLLPCADGHRGEGGTGWALFTGPFGAFCSCSFFWALALAVAFVLFLLLPFFPLLTTVRYTVCSESPAPLFREGLRSKLN